MSGNDDECENPQENNDSTSRVLFILSLALLMFGIQFPLVFKDLGMIWSQTIWIELLIVFDLATVYVLVRSIE